MKYRNTCARLLIRINRSMFLVTSMKKKELKKQKKHHKIGFQDSFHCYDKILWDNKEITLKCGSRLIDSLATSEGLAPYLEGCIVDG